MSIGPPTYYLQLEYLPTYSNMRLPAHSSCHAKGGWGHLSCLFFWPRRSTSTAPSAKDFERLWDAACMGAVSKGLEGIGSGKKCWKMQWCLGEAIRRLDKDFLANSSAICLHRDATGGTLLCKFQASDRDLNLHCGIFGVQKHYGSSGLDITTATDKMYKALATKNVGAPSRRAGAGGPGRSLDSKFEKHCKLITMFIGGGSNHSKCGCRREGYSSCEQAGYPKTCPRRRLPVQHHGHLH